MKSLLLPLAVCAGLVALAQTPVFVPPVSHITNGASLAGPSTYWSVAADFNGDGRPDFAAPDGRVADNIQGISYVLSTPSGGYSAPAALPVGFFVSGIATADFNRDGRIDLALTGSATAILLGNGAGSFFAPLRVSLPVVPGAGGNCAAADLNQDGNPDLLVPGSSGLAVALGNGDGSFRPAALYSMAVAPIYVLTGDFNQDGRLDALAAVNSVTSASMFLGNGDGSFQPAFPILPVPYGALAADFNNDGKLDLVMQTAQPRQDGSNFSIAISLGLAGGRFQQYSNYVFATPLSGHVPADFNQDGRIDIATVVNGNLKVLAGRGDGSLGPVLYDAPADGGPFSLLSADADSNGSPDLVLAAYSHFKLFRNPRGNPPLLARLALDNAAVVGGAASATGVVTLGGPAPAGGVQVALTSSDPAVTFPAGASVNIPAGASSAGFSIATAAVTIATPVTINASANGVSHAATLELVPGFTMTGFTLAPARQYGIFSTTGTVTLSGPAASSTFVVLVSSNPALAVVPPSVTVPAGATSASFPITLAPVAADTAVSISASFAGVTTTSILTVLRPLDSVQLARSSYTQKSFSLRVEATGTNATASLTIYNAATGAPIGTLRNAGGGKYDGSFTVNLGATPRITLKSTLGGTVTVPVTVK